MSQQLRPVTAVTMGDPAGIGPEIVLHTMQDEGLYEVCKPFLIGTRKHLEKAAELANASISINEIDGPEDAKFEHGVIDLLDPHRS